MHQFHFCLESIEWCQRLIKFKLYDLAELKEGWEAPT